jgi:hypothetical protein
MQKLIGRILMNRPWAARSTDSRDLTRLYEFKRASNTFINLLRLTGAKEYNVGSYKNNFTGAVNWSPD